eukprot:TRINITY_DN7648_c0_g1_i1.p1 TRINITY_DN7648_c0_g1~~TRINITY_DN7648_c0_g1_i1.p1  ORF type:complete len:255 (+),score=40.80 TRINITY_DN7648_c0_g1_i1:107-766(+)
MFNAMKSVVKMDKELSPKERNLFSISIKTVLFSLRNAWGVLTNLEFKNKPESNSKSLQIREYREKIEKELLSICDDVVTIIENHLLKHAASIESKIFYLKMKGDHLRYMVEFSTGELRKEVTNKALASYKTAFEYFKYVSPTNPIRLVLVLNYSVFLYEVSNNLTEAVLLATQAFNEAMEGLDGLSEESYKDTTLILQSLRDYITLWTSYEGGENTEEE